MPVESLIKSAKKAGVDFGKGDPYNRIRYYTKIGWLPHMVRKKDKTGKLKGHFVPEALETLLNIEKLRTSGLSKDEISKQLKLKLKKETATKSLSNLKQFITGKKIFIGIIALLLALSIVSELGLIRIGHPKNLSIQTPTESVTQILEKGMAFVPTESSEITVDCRFCSSSTQIQVTFMSDYSPASRYWISEVRDFKGFVLKLDTKVLQNAPFSWVIIK